MDIKKLIRVAKPNIADTSVTAYFNNYRKLDKDINESKGGTYFLLNTELIMKYLNTKSYLVKRNYLNMIIVILQTLDPVPKDVIDYYVIDRDKGNLKYEEFTNTNQKSEKEEKNWIPYETIITIMNSLEKIDTYKEFLYLKLNIAYTLRNDWRELKIITQRALKNQFKLENKNEQETKKMNYFVKYKRNYYLYIRSFKTASTYSDLKIEINPELNKYIRKYLRIFPTNKYLFEKDGKPYSTQDFTKFVELIFASTGKRVGSTMLRHILITEKHGKDIKEQKESARVSGHSTSTQAKYVKL
jgi:hypothetical protein